MAIYHVTYECLFSTTVEADCPEMAADIASEKCLYDINSGAFVVDAETGEEWNEI